jgi:hypothetical protein
MKSLPAEIAYQADGNDRHNPTDGPRFGHMHLRSCVQK